MTDPAGWRRVSESVDALLDKAYVQGYLTREDLVEACSTVSDDKERMDSLLVTLRQRGVEFIDQGSGDSRIGEIKGPESDIDPYTKPTQIPSDDTIGLYFKEMSMVPLLSAREELEIAKRIERGKLEAILLKHLPFWAIRICLGRIKHISKLISGESVLHDESLDKALFIAELERRLKPAPV